MIVAAVLSSVTDSFMSVVPVSVVAPVTPSVVPTVTAADAVSALVTVAECRVARPPVVSLCLTATVDTLLTTVSPMMSVVPEIPMSAAVNRTDSRLATASSILDLTCAESAEASASRAFATGCRAAECVSADLDGLDPSQLRELDRWMEMYETHDKYTFVGTLVEDPVDKYV